MRISILAFSLAACFSPGLSQESWTAPLPLPFLDAGTGRLVQMVPRGTPVRLLEYQAESGFWRVALPGDPTGGHYLCDPRLLGKSVATGYARGRPLELALPAPSEAGYLLYLPRSYSSSSPPPLILAFSPLGEGASMVGILEPLAERKGWVVAAVNGLGNGYNPHFYRDARAVLAALRREVPHDWSREYLAGFSGGAQASYRLSQAFWNEFAGILALGGWLGEEEAGLYPSRLSVAMLNGQSDSGAREWEKHDRQRLQRCGIRTRVFRFKGGHEVAPRHLILEAVEWLERQWQRRPAGLGPDAAAQGLWQAWSHFRSGEDQHAFVQLVHLLLEFPFSHLTPAARNLLEDLLLDPARRSHLGPPGAASLPGGQLGDLFFTMARGVFEDPDPRLPRAYLEAGLVAAPNSPRLLARLAYLLEIAADFRDPARAAALASRAVRQDPGAWLGWYALGRAQLQEGRSREAARSARRAWERAPAAARDFCRNLLDSIKPGGRRE